MDNIRKTKEKVAAALFNRDVWIKRVSDVEIRTRCPFCGDSEHNENTGHLYIRIDLDDNFPMIYNCFRCPAKGIVDKDLLDALGVYDDDLSSELKIMNKKADSLGSYSYLNREKTTFYDYNIPKIDMNDSNSKRKLDYVFNRIGISEYDETDIERLKIITSFKDFLIENNINELTTTASIAKNIEDHYVGFLSYGNSYILFRDITNKEKILWLKYPITKASRGNRIFYAISSTIDILSYDEITINLSEGVMDIISCYYNLKYNKDNMLNIAVCGKGYNNIMKYLISLGLYGGNVKINVFADNDLIFNPKTKKDDKSITTLEYFEHIFNRMKYLFKEVNIYYNEIGKDIGVPKDKIVLNKYKLRMN